MRVTPWSLTERFAMVSEGPRSLAIRSARNQPSFVGVAPRVESARGGIWESDCPCLSVSLYLRLRPAGLPRQRIKASFRSAMLTPQPCNRPPSGRCQRLPRPPRRPRHQRLKQQHQHRRLPPPRLPRKHRSRKLPSHRRPSRAHPRRRRRPRSPSALSLPRCDRLWAATGLVWRLCRPGQTSHAASSSRTRAGRAPRRVSYRRYRTALAR